MMNSIFRAFFIFFLLSLSCHCLGSTTNTIELRVAHFRPSSDLFCKIYHHTLIEYEIECSQPIARFEIWENISWLPASGHSIEERHSTSLSLLPLSLGIKYRFTLPSFFSIGAGFGGAYYFLWVNDNTPCPCIEKHRNFSGPGAVIKTELRYSRFSKFISIFFDYIYLPLKNSSGLCQNCGGLKTGGAIGFHF